MGYDMIPWKLVFCKLDPRDCSEPPAAYISDLPPAPEPGRIPEGCEHLHIRVKLSADQRGAREDARWMRLLAATARCEHGRLHGDACVMCPEGRSPERAGVRVGYTVYGIPVIIPPRGKTNDYDSWFPDDSR